MGSECIHGVPEILSDTPTQLKNKNIWRLCKKFLFSDDTDWSKILEDDVYEEMIKNKSYKKILKENFNLILKHKQYLHSITDENNVNYPIDINRICKNQKNL